MKTLNEKIGIDEQIAFQSATAKYTGKPEDAAILATLRDYKRVKELLREPSELMISEGLSAEGHIDDEFKAMSAALLAEVEQAQN
jgi:hypothetical protein